MCARASARPRASTDTMNMCGDDDDDDSSSSSPLSVKDKDEEEDDLLRAIGRFHILKNDRKRTDEHG
jgi:hypothetical protein